MVLIYIDTQSEIILKSLVNHKNGLGYNILFENVKKFGLRSRKTYAKRIKDLLEKKLVIKAHGKHGKYFISTRLDDIEDKIGFYDASLNTSIDNFLDLVKIFSSIGKIEKACKYIELAYNKINSLTTLVFYWANAQKPFVDYISKKLIKISTKYRVRIENFLKENRELSEIWKDYLLKLSAEDYKEIIDVAISETKKFENLLPSSMKETTRNLIESLEKIKSHTSTNTAKHYNEGYIKILRELYLKG